MSEQGLSDIDKNVVPVGHRIPADDPFAVSVSLPKIADVKAYEEGVPEFRANLKGGYPRFVFHSCYKEVCNRYRDFLSPNEDLLVLPSTDVAAQCVSFIGRGRVSETRDGVALAIFPKEEALLAKSFWQHTGLIISSRQAEAILAGREKPSSRGPLQELRRHLAGLQDVNPDDVYVSPTGMSAIYSAYQAVSAIRGTKTIQLGFPYTDTLAIQEKFGKGSHYVPYNTPHDLEKLRLLVEQGDISAVFCEVPGNPLLKTVDLQRLKKILAPYGIPLIIDNTLGTWLDIDVSPYTDVTVTSLTKYFAGTGNVMGGAATLNRNSPHYLPFKRFFQGNEQLLYPDDATALLKSSEGFVERMAKINHTAVQLADFLRHHPAVKDVFYTDRDPAYEAIRKNGGGYGGLLSFTLKDPTLLAEVYDNLQFPKGPSLGTNFTLICPYPLLVHYGDFNKTRTSNIADDLMRVAVGTENSDEIISRFKTSLDNANTSPSVSRTFFTDRAVTVVPASTFSL